MNLSRSLFALPVVFVAAVTAAACSSSSTANNGGTGSDGGSTATTGGQTADCMALAACCTDLAANSNAAAAAMATNCEKIAAAGGAACTSNLSALTKGGYCGGSSSNSSSTGGNASTTTTGVSPTTSSNPTGTTATTGSGGSSTTGGGGHHDGGGGVDSGPSGTCANPPSSPPVGFAGPTGIVGTGCTSAEVQEYATCSIAAASMSNPGCFNSFIEGAPDGMVNACGQCLEATFIQPGMNAPSAWGLDTIVLIQPSIGDTADAWPLNFGPEAGVCIYAAGGMPAHECALDVMTFDDCIFSVCAAVCPIPNPGTGPINGPAESALNACINTAVVGACADYLTKAQTACTAWAGKDAGSKGNKVIDMCNLLVDQTYNTPQEGDQVPEAGPATAKGEAQLLELACGGGDAGF